MDVSQFRKDYLRRKAESGFRQKDVAMKYGVDQATLSRFERALGGISLDAALRLWNFVYPNSSDIHTARCASDA